MDTTLAIRRVIIVDDDKNMRYLIRRIVARKHPAAHIFETMDGVEALRLYESAGADLMLIDHRIPLLDGLDLVRAIRAKNVTLPLVMVSSDSAKKDESLTAGVTCFVDKKELVRGLTEFLETQPNSSSGALLGTGQTATSSSIK